MKIMTMDPRGLPFFIFLTTMLIGSNSCSNVNSEASDPAWDKVQEIIDQIIPPVIPDRDFSITEFGGQGDGITDNKQVFDSIIHVCSSMGGGTIRVEPGTYLVNGPLHLKSHINLHLEEGARLVFGSNPEDYLPVVLTSWEGTRLYNYSPFIYAFQVNDVSITGKGEIDGEASGTWNNWKSLQKEDQALCRSMNNENTPLEERIFGAGHFLRPHLIQFYECSNILVEGITISDAPFWCIHPIFSKNIIIRDLVYNAYNLNNDGIDPESSENILIENITFGNNDDNVAIKAGRDLEGRSLGRSTKNIVIRNCKFKGHNAIAVGSEMSGGVHDVYVEDCSYGGRVIYGVYLKGNRDRGGEVSNIYARNIEFDTTLATIIIDSNYKNEGSCCPPKFRNVYIEDITSNYAADYGIYIKGFEAVPLDSIFIKNVNILSARQSLSVEHADHLYFENVRVNGEYLKQTEQ